jgi:uncharacterized membrane protein YvbJ
MYCSSCGSAVPQNLSYCNRCGAKAGGGKADAAGRPTELSPDSLLNVVAAIFVVGIGAIVFLMALIKDGPVNPFILAAAMLIFALVILVEGVLLGLLVSRNRSAKKAAAAAAALSQEQVTKELNAAQARVLPEPAPSVTEHTTRTFDPVYSERKTK